MLDRDADFAVAVYTLQGAIENIEDLYKERDGYKLRRDEAEIFECFTRLGNLYFSLREAEAEE